MNKQPVYSRLDKINSLLFRELNNLLIREPFEKNGQNNIILSITKIETSKDLHYAKVFFTIMPLKYRGQAKYFLDAQRSEWQKIIGDKIAIKYTPRLQFVFDKGQQNAFVVEEILNKLKHES